MSNLLKAVQASTVRNAEVFVIDYGYKDMYRVYVKSFANSCFRLNENDDFIITSQEYFTIGEKVTKVEYLQLINGAVSHYTNNNGDQLSADKYAQLRTEVNSKSEYDEEQEITVFDTKEVKELNAYLNTFKPEYFPAVEKWTEFEFKEIKKILVEKRYEDYIISDIQLGMTEIKPICTYVRDRKKMAEKILKEKGYENKNLAYDAPIQKVYKDIGDAIFIHKGPTIKPDCRIENKNAYLPNKVTATYQECVDAFEKDYEEILSAINLHSAKCSNEKMEPDSLANVIQAFDKIQNELQELDKHIKSNTAIYITRDIYSFISKFKTELVNGK